MLRGALKCCALLIFSGCGEGAVSKPSANADSSGGSLGSGFGGARPIAGAAGRGGGAGHASGGAGSHPEPSSGCNQQPVLAPADAPNAGWPYIDDERTRLLVNGKQREFSVYVPPDYDRTKAYALYFTFHGCGGGKSPSAYIQATGGKAIVIAPQGLQGSCGAGVSGWLRAKDSEDFEFFDKLMQWAESGYCIDKKRVFAAGHSHGAWFTGQLGCYRGDVLRAIQPQSGGPVDLTACKSQVAALFVHHVDDGSVRIADGEAFRDQYLAANHCSRSTAPAAQAPCVEYQGCDSGFPVAWCPLAGDIYWEYGKMNVDPHNAPWAWAPIGEVTVNFFSGLTAKP